MDHETNNLYGRLIWVPTLLVLALTLRMLVAFGVDIPIGGDANHYLNIAQEIRTHHRFALNDQITAHRPPLYSIFLAAGRSVTENEDIIRLLQCLMSVGVLYLIFRIMKLLEVDQIGLLGALALGAVSPSWIYYPAVFLSEILFGFFLFVGVFLWSLSLQPKQSRLSIPLLLLSGIFLGLATLTRSVVLLFPIILFAIGVILPERRKLLKPILILTIVWGFTLLPWTIRNYVQFEAIIPVNTMGGIVLWQAANPSPEGFGFTPWEEIDDVAGTRNEVERNRVLTQKALETYIDDPVRTLRLTAIKFLWFWNPWDGDSYGLGTTFNPHTFILLFLSAWFLWSWGIDRKGRPPNSKIHSWILPSLLGYFLLMALLFYGSPRFRMPVEPILWISSGIGFSRIMGMRRRKREIALFVLLGSTLVFFMTGDALKDILRMMVDALFGYREFLGTGST